MKKTIAKFLILAALFLSAATISAEEKDGQKVYRGTVSIGYTAPLNFNVRTTHGVVYDRSNIFIGGEAQYRFGFEDGSIVKAGAAFRWSYVSRKLVDAYLGCGGGLHVSKNGSTGLNGELVNNFGMGFTFRPSWVWVSAWATATTSISLSTSRWTFICTAAAVHSRSEAPR